MPKSVTCQPHTYDASRPGATFKYICYNSLTCRQYKLYWTVSASSHQRSAWVQIQVWKGVFQLNWTSGHAMRLNSWTGREGLPVSSLNCDRSLHSGLKAPELVMDAGCRDNRCTASLCTWLPGCSPLVLPPSQEMGSAWASLSLVGCRYTSKGMFHRNPQS